MSEGREDSISPLQHFVQIRRDAVYWNFERRTPETASDKPSDSLLYLLALGGSISSVHMSSGPPYLVIIINAQKSSSCCLLYNLFV
jgi:hypothetical protein